MAFFLARWPSFAQKGLHMWKQNLALPQRGELVLIPIGFAKELSLSSQPNLLVDFGPIEAQGWEHWLT